VSDQTDAQHLFTHLRKACLVLELELVREGEVVRLCRSGVRLDAEAVLTLYGDEVFPANITPVTLDRVLLGGLQLAHIEVCMDALFQFQFEAKFHLQ
jgi:hypothetical protein